MNKKKKYKAPLLELNFINKVEVLFESLGDGDWGARFEWYTDEQGLEV